MPRAIAPSACPPSVAGVVLAAGSSARLGRAKQLVRFCREPLVRRAARAATRAGLSPVVVVVGARAGEVRSVLEGLPVGLVRNAGWREGLASSIRSGVRAVRDAPGVGAVMLMVCDQPALDASVLRKLLRAWHGGARPAAACAYAGTLGVPAVFGRSSFPALMRLRGDHGAKTVLRREGRRVARIAWPAGARDVDRVADTTRGGARCRARARGARR